MSNSQELPDFRELVDRVKEATDIVQVIGRHIGLDRHNKAVCPFHEEKKPSFSVNPKGQYFHCFGCGVGGDVFRFLELYKKQPFIEVLSELAQEAGLSLFDVTPEERERLREERSIEEILIATAEFYHRNLSDKVKSYLTKKRGFTEETISQFKIGYAHGGLREHLIIDSNVSNATHGHHEKPINTG